MLQCILFDFSFILDVHSYVPPYLVLIESVLYWLGDP